MKSKKYVAAITAGLLALAMPVTGTAKDNYNVWIDEAELKSNAQEINVEIKTDGKSTDGLLVINYDASVLQVEEEDIIWSDDVEMYSANIIQEGTLKMAYLSENAIEDDVIATIMFTTSGNSAIADAIDLSGDVHDGEGNILNVGKKVEKPSEEEKPSENEQPSSGETEDAELPENNEEGVETGDGAEAFSYIVSCGICAAIFGITLKYRMKGRKE